MALPCLLPHYALVETRRSVPTDPHRLSLRSLCVCCHKQGTCFHSGPFLSRLYAAPSLRWQNAQLRALSRSPDPQLKEDKACVSRRLAELQRGTSRGEEALEAGHYPDVLSPVRPAGFGNVEGPSSTEHIPR